MKYSELMSKFSGEDGYADARILREELLELSANWNISIEVAYAELLVTPAEIENYPTYGFLVADDGRDYVLNTNYYRSGSTLRKAEVLGLWLRYQKVPEKVQTSDWETFTGASDLKQVSLSTCSEDDNTYAEDFANEMLLPYEWLKSKLVGRAKGTNYSICTTADITTAEFREILGRYELL